MKRGSCVVALAWLAGAVGGVCSAQAQEPPAVVMIATGGYLGYLDGQRAAPGETYGWTDAPRGGVFGSAEWLAEHRAPGDILLLSGNNLPQDLRAEGLRQAVLAIGRPPAWLAADRRNRTLPNAVAVGIDDLLRGLKSGGAARLHALLRDPEAAPFVVSNAFVRLRRGHLNRIASGQYRLQLPRDESVDWVSTLEVTCDRCANVDVSLREQTADGVAQEFVVTATPDVSYRRLTLRLPRPLRPNGRYQLTIAGRDGSPPARFEFQTHGALARVTEATDPHAPARLRGLPIRYVSRPAAVRTDAGSGPDACPARGLVEAPIVIVGLVDPTVKDRLASSLWRWQGEGCPAYECEIDFLAPLAALDAMRQSVLSADPCDPPPAFALLSGLTDAQLPVVIAERPEVRWIVMETDSRIMGTKRGREGVINASTPDTTQLWARPQWVGSSATTMRAQLTWRRRPSAPYRQSIWELTGAASDTAIVEGRALDWTISARPGRAPAIEYVSKGDGHPIAGPFDAYPPFPGMLTPQLSQGRLWTDLSEMAAFLLNIMRERGHADVAVVPSEFIDDETLDWLASEYQASGPLNWLSRFIAARVFFRDERIVVVEVPGSEVVDVINGVIATERGRANNLFAAGLGTNQPVARLERTQLVNGRAIHPRHYYRVAMPQSVAQQNGLTPDHIVIGSLLDEIDRRMLAASGAAPITRGSLGEQLEERFARRARVYVNAAPARFDFQNEVVNEGNGGVFGNIPLEGRSAQPQEQWGFAGTAELGIDYRAVAYRITGEATFARQAVAGTITYPTDEWTAGFRMDWKLGRRAVHRLFAGVFRQSWFSDHVADSITPTRTVENFVDPVRQIAVPSAIIPGPSVRPSVKRPVFDFLRAGIDLDAVSWKFVTLRGAAVAYDLGEVHRDRDTVSIAGGPALTLDRVYQAGLSQLVHEAFQADPVRFNANPTLAFGYADHRQRRLQLDGTLQVAPGLFRGGSWATTARYRSYLGKAQRVDFTANQSILVRSQIDWPMLHRLRVGPFIDYYRVDAKGASGPFEDRKLGIAIEAPFHIAIKPGGWWR